MGLSVVFHGSQDGDTGPFSLASATGWKLFGEWVETLPKPEYQCLHSLVEDGHYEGSDMVAKELDLALRKYHPENEGVENTTYELLEKIGVGSEDETITVTDE